MSNTRLDKTLRTFCEDEDGRKTRNAYSENITERSRDGSMEGVAFDHRALFRRQFGSSQPHLGEGRAKAEIVIVALMSEAADSLVDAERAAEASKGTREHAGDVENDEGAKLAAGGTMNSEPAGPEGTPEGVGETACEDGKDLEATSIAGPYVS